MKKWKIEMRMPQILRRIRFEFTGRMLGEMMVSILLFSIKNLKTGSDVLCSTGVFIQSKY